MMEDRDERRILDYDTPPPRSDSYFRWTTPILSFPGLVFLVAFAWKAFGDPPSRWDKAFYYLLTILLLPTIGFSAIVLWRKLIASTTQIPLLDWFCAAVAMISGMLALGICTTMVVVLIFL